MAASKFASRINKIKDKRAAPKQSSSKNGKESPRSPAYVKRYAALRTRRLEKRVGKPMIFGEEAMLRIMMDRKVPTMMQHCIIKVEKKMTGNDKMRFLSAFNICTWVFRKYNYLRVTKTTMAPTPKKGMIRNRRHQMEKEAGKKNAAYARLVRQLWAADMKALAQENNTKG